MNCAGAPDASTAMARMFSTLTSACSAAIRIAPLPEPGRTGTRSETARTGSLR